MAITTVADLITIALKRINVVQAGQVAQPEDLSDAFDFCNLYLEALQGEGLTVPFVQRVTWALTSTKGSPTNPYTVGPTGDVAIPRPVNMAAIDRVAWVNTTQTATQQVEIRMTPLTDAAYEAVPIKGLTSPYPGSWYYAPTYASGFGSLYIWLLPTSANLNGVMYVASAVPQFTALTQTIALPAAWKFFLEENLAVKLAATFRENLPPDPVLVQSARESKAVVKRLGSRPVDLALDPAVTMGHGARYNIFTDG